METLSALVDRYYSVADQASRLQLEKSVQKLRESPINVPVILKEVICPALNPSTNSSSHKFHPQFVFICLGLLQDAVHQWTHLSLPNQEEILHTLNEIFNGSEIMKWPSYVSLKLVQIIAEIAIHTCGSTFNPIPFLLNELEHYLVHGTPSPSMQGQSPPPSQFPSTYFADRFVLNLALVMETADSFRNAQNCKYISSQQIKDVSILWEQESIKLAAFLERALYLLGLKVPISNGSEQSHPSISAYPSPVSPNPPHSFTGPTIPVENMCQLLSLIHLLPHALERSTLILVQKFVRDPSIKVSFEAIDALSAQLDPSIIHRNFSGLLDVLIDELSKTVSHGVPLCLQFTSIDQSGIRDDPDDVDDTLDMEDNDSAVLSSPESNRKSIIRHYKLVHKILRDLALPISTTYLSRLSAAQLIQFANVLVPAMQMPKSPGSEARKALLEVIKIFEHSKMNRGQYYGFIKYATEHVVNQLNHLQISDLDNEDELVSKSFKEDAFGLQTNHFDQTTPLDHTRLSQVINLMEIIGDLNLLETVQKIFPALNTAVGLLETYINTGPPDKRLPDEILIMYAVSLRIMTQLIPKCDSVADTASIPDLVSRKCLSLIVPLSKRVMSCHLTLFSSATNTYRALKETLFLLHSCIPCLKNMDLSVTLEPLSALINVFQVFSTLILSDPNLGDQFYALSHINARFIAAMCPSFPESVALVDQLGASYVFVTGTTSDIPLGPLKDALIRGLLVCSIQSHHPTNNVEKLSVAHISLSNSSRLYSVLGLVMNAIPNLTSKTTSVSKTQLNILCSLIRAVQNDSALIKADVLSVIYQLNWMPTLMDEMTSVLKHPVRNSDRARIVELTQVFSTYITTFMKSDVAQGLITAFIENPRVLTSLNLDIEPLLSDLFIKLVQNGPTFEHAIPQFGHMLIKNLTQINITPSFLRLLSTILLTHWHAFFSSGKRADNQITFMCIVAIFIQSIGTKELELVKCAIKHLNHINGASNFFTYPIWITGFRDKAIESLVMCLISSECASLQDGLIQLLKEMFTNQSATEFKGLQTLMFKVILSLTPSKLRTPDKSSKRSAWELQLRNYIETLSDLSKFEPTVRSMVHDFICLSV